MKTGIIFDMDGTLWNSAPQVAESWNEALRKEGYTKRAPITEEDMYRVMGKTMDVLAGMIFPDEDEQVRKRLLQVCSKYEIAFLREHGGILYPDLENTLTKLREDYDLFIVSNCQSGYIEAFLEYYGFGYLFKDIECYGNNNKQKGENIALVVERNHLDRAVYVGDIQGDYDASRAAGVDFIHAAYGFGTIHEEVPKIDRFSDLPEVMKEIY